MSVRMQQIIPTVGHWVVVYAHYEHTDELYWTAPLIGWALCEDTENGLQAVIGVAVEDPMPPAPVDENGECFVCYAPAAEVEDGRVEERVHRHIVAQMGTT